MLVKRQREAKMGGKPQRQASRIGCTDYIFHIWERVNTGGGKQGSGDRKRGNGPEESAESLSMRSSSINWLSQHKKYSTVVCSVTTQHKLSAAKTLRGSAWVQTATKPHPTLKKRQEWNKMATAFISFTQTPQASLPQRRLIPHNTDHCGM